MGDILDRSDKSLAPVPHAGGDSVSVAKRSKFCWSQGGKPGRFMMIDKMELGIDGEYQRDQASETKVREIARSWDWMLFGVLMATQRPDGTFWVYDGGHRLRASFYRDDIRELPCMVYATSDLSEEAKAFLGKNLMITNVSSLDKYKAAVVAKDVIANKVAGILSELGIEVAPRAGSARQLKCIGTLMAMVEEDAFFARRCLLFCVEQSDGRPVSSQVLRAIFTLCRHFSGQFDFLDEYSEKLSRHSQKEMEIRIRSKVAEIGKGGEKIEALAILDLVNKGCRRKLTW